MLHVSTFCYFIYIKQLTPDLSDSSLGGLTIPLMLHMLLQLKCEWGLLQLR